jgi:hypothetical protein
MAIIHGQKTIVLAMETRIYIITQLLHQKNDPHYSVQVQASFCYRTFIKQKLHSLIKQTHVAIKCDFNDVLK